MSEVRGVKVFCEPRLTECVIRYVSLAKSILKSKIRNKLTLSTDGTLDTDLRFSQHDAKGHASRKRPQCKLRCTLDSEQRFENPFS